MQIVVLGGTGMLGSMLVEVLSRDSQLSVVATARSAAQVEFGEARAPQVKWRLFEVTANTTSASMAALPSADWYLNAVGLTKPYTHDDNLVEIRQALLVNALWPLELAEFAGERGAQVLQIGTDCAYQGLKGNYRESEAHDPTDVYGKTKSLGEAPHPAMHILRTSIIGPEPQDKVFLLAWLLGQPSGATVNGYTNHLWNGVTTLHFARVVRGIVINDLSLPPVHHLVPGDTVDKSELLQCAARSFQRDDLTVTPTDAPIAVDRTLATEHTELNRQLWLAAGYSAPPSIAQMVEELAGYPYQFAGRTGVC